MILTLLTKVVIFYVQISIKKIGIFGLKIPIAIGPRTCQGLILSVSITDFSELPEKFIGKS